MSLVLQVVGINKRFGGIHAVRDVSLDVSRGELLGLFGPNGAGKTTLFNLIAGAYPPSAGAVRLNGADVTRLPAHRRARAGIARTFQVCRPFRTLSVLENVLAAVPSVHARDAGEDAARRILRHVGLEPQTDMPAGTLTLGMLKRLEVARALALGPQLLLLDEPLAGLTAAETAELLAFIRTLTDRASVILIDHNVRQTLTICDRAIVLDAGAIIAAGSPDEIRADSNVRRAYLGDEGH
jgi:branched-chain amino acid transport system ATP-binding protein